MKNFDSFRFGGRCMIIVFLFAVLTTLLPWNASAQMRKEFTPRTSPYAGNRIIYNLQGDFAIIGNSNMVIRNASNNSNNGSQTDYVDIDNVANTCNSSSATLKFRATNNAGESIIPTCTDIVYAGLYWTGRAHDGASQNTFTISNYFSSDVTVPVSGGSQTNTYTSSSFSLTESQRVLTIAQSNFSIRIYRSGNAGSHVRYDVRNSAGTVIGIFQFVRNSGTSFTLQYKGG